MSPRVEDVDEQARPRDPFDDDFDMPSTSNRPPELLFCIHGVGDTVGSGAVRSLMIPVGLESSSAEALDSAFIFMSSAVMAGEAEGVRLGEAGSGRLCHDESRDPYRSLMSRA